MNVSLLRTSKPRQFGRLCGVFAERELPWQLLTAM
jgi:hypothetical protein